LTIRPKCLDIANIPMAALLALFGADFHEPLRAKIVPSVLSKHNRALLDECIVP